MYNYNKEITIIVPTYNEEINIPLIYQRISDLFNTKLQNYNYKILFVDNKSKDKSRSVIRMLAQKDKRVQYIFYVRNFGFSKSTFYALGQAEGDAAILLFADMQDPPELIEKFIFEWENGFQVVIGIKNKSQENRVIYKIRSLYYYFINEITEIDHINQFTGFGLYDRKMLNIFSRIDDPLPYLRGIVAELSPECKRIYYEQEKRKYGKTSFNFWNLYDVAMLGITSYSKSLMRIAVIIGTLISTISLVIAFITVILKTMKIIDYPVGNAAILFGVYLFGGLITLFLGIQGEYIANINIRTMHHPIVIEDERHNLTGKKNA